ncbi:MAG: hypothetical protein LWY06_15540 [Firmicutes bacterium]|nr:hypothetical protein [Bacillota bacterium]
MDENLPEPQEKKPVIKWILLIILTGTGIFCLYNLPPTFFKTSMDSGCYTQCRTNLRRIGTALKLYAEDNNGNYPPNLRMLTGKYLKEIPLCSEADKDTYSQDYQFYNNEQEKIHRYTFYCNGKWHVRMGIRENYPQYTSMDKLISR